MRLFNVSAPWLPPITSIILPQCCRLYFLLAASRFTGTSIFLRMGLPVINILSRTCSGKYVVLASNVANIFVAYGDNLTVTLPGTEFCSQRYIDIFASLAAIRAGAETYPPIPITACISSFLIIRKALNMAQVKRIMNDGNERMLLNNAGAP